MMSNPTAAWARDEKDDGADQSHHPCRDLPVDLTNQTIVLAAINLSDPDIVDFSK